MRSELQKQAESQAKMKNTWKEFSTKVQEKFGQMSKKIEDALKQGFGRQITFPSDAPAPEDNHGELIWDIRSGLPNPLIQANEEAADPRDAEDSESLDDERSYEWEGSEDGDLASHQGAEVGYGTGNNERVLLELEEYRSCLLDFVEGRVDEFRDLAMESVSDNGVAASPQPVAEHFLQAPMPCTDMSILDMDLSDARVQRS